MEKISGTQQIASNKTPIEPKKHPINQNTFKGWHKNWANKFQINLVF